VTTSAPGPYGITAGFVEKVTNPSGGAPTWAAITPPGVGSFWGFSGVALDPTSASSVYVTELNDYNPADRIWHSANGGSSWSVITPNSNRDNSSAAYANSLNVHWMGDLEIDLARKAGFEPVQTSTAPDGGNLVSVFRAAADGGAANSRLEGNYTRVSRIVRGYTSAGYYLSASPYAGPLGRLRAFLKDRAATRGRANAREVLDGLIEQT
jgi:hypothetical protein